LGSYNAGLFSKNQSGGACRVKEVKGIALMGSFETFMKEVEEKQLLS